MCVYNRMIIINFLSFYRIKLNIIVSIEHVKMMYVISNLYTLHLTMSKLSITLTFFFHTLLIFFFNLYVGSCHLQEFCYNDKKQHRNTYMYISKYINYFTCGLLSTKACMIASLRSSGPNAPTFKGIGICAIVQCY